MINLIVWSKDRAAQLHLLLESIKQYAPNTFITSIIFTSSNDSYSMGYERVKKEFSGDDFLFVQEKNLWENTREILNRPEKLVGFSTDDTVLYRPLPENITNILSPDTITFSLRYGLNTVMQNYHTQEYQPSLQNYMDEGNTILWRFSDYHPLHNYGYPFGLDMHIYRRDDILKLTKYQDLKSTNELESHLFKHAHLVPPMIRSFKESVAVNIPVNNLSGITRAGETYDNPVEFLNEQYINGNTLNLEKIAETKIIGSHQEIQLEWRKHQLIDQKK